MTTPTPEEQLAALQKRADELQARIDELKRQQIEYLERKLAR